MWPVRYSTGELILSQQDITSNGFGKPWGHTRSFVSRQSASETIGNGINWQVAEWPFLAITPNNESNSDGGVLFIVAQGHSGEELWFDNNDGEFTVRFGLLNTLEHLTSTGQYQLTYPDGTVVLYDDSNGAFEKQTNPGGDVIEAISYNSNGYNLEEVQRSYTADGTTTTERLQYSYDSSQGDALLSSVTLSRKVGAGSWTNVQRATYT